jgi:aminopeptidase N
VPMIRYGRERMTDASYSVGMLMFAALDQRLGRPALDRIVGGYYQRYHETGGTTEDLVRLGRELSGGASDEIFDSWLLTTRWVDELEAWFPG